MSKLYKELLFIILTVLTVGLSYFIFWVINDASASASRGPAYASVLMFILTLGIVALFLSIIVFIMLVRRFKSRLMILCTIVAIPFVIETLLFLNEAYQNQQTQRQIATTHKVEEKYAKAWRSLASPETVEAIIAEINASHGEELEPFIFISAQNDALFLALMMKHEGYQIPNALKPDQQHYFNRKAPKILLKHYFPSTEREIVIFYEALEHHSFCLRYLDDCIYFRDGERLSFEKMVEAKFYNAAALRLKFKSKFDKSILERIALAKDISDEKVRHALLVMLLNDADIFVKNRDFKTVITANEAILLLQNERNLSDYVALLEKQLSVVSAEAKNPEELWKFDLSQKGLDTYSAVYDLLGEDHSYILAIPAFLRQHYHKKLKARASQNSNPILFRTFVLQIRNTQLLHPYVKEPYKIIRDGIVLDKGNTNLSGCVQYTFYDAKPGDIITISTSPFTWNEYIGIGQLLDQQSYLVYYLKLRGFAEDASDDEIIRTFQRVKNIEETGKVDKLTVAMAQKDYLETYTDERCN